MNYKAGIYKLTSPNGKCYIGQTNNLYSRLNSYKNYGCKGQIKIYRALLKYGFENFKIDILWGTNDNTNLKIILNQLEGDFINLYDSINNGYNLMSGGDFVTHSEETKRKISEKTKGILSFHYGKKRLKSSVELSNKAKFKEVIQYDKEMNFIKEWKSITEATLNINVSKTNISNNLKKISKSAGGFIWKYKKEMEVSGEL